MSPNYSPVSSAVEDVNRVRCDYNAHQLLDVYPLCLVINNQRHYKYIFDRLGYKIMSTLTYWSFCFLYFFISFLMRRKSVINTFLSSLSHEFEPFGSLHVCTKEKYRPQRDSNPIHPCPELANEPGATIYQYFVLSTSINHLYYIGYVGHLLSEFLAIYIGLCPANLCKHMRRWTNLQRWFNIGPALQTVNHRWATSHVCWPMRHHQIGVFFLSLYKSYWIQHL